MAGIGDRPEPLRRPGLPPPRDRFVGCRGRGDEEEDEEKGSRVNLAEASLLNKLIHTSLVESSHSVEILQQDPSSPLFSVKTFEELPLKKELLEGIYAMGFNRPSKIQGTALPIMLAYPPQNLIAQSQSGTGKTAAFALAMLSRVNATEKHPQPCGVIGAITLKPGTETTSTMLRECLCLAPTYELALQIGQVIEKIGLFCTDIRVTYAIRGNRVRQGTVSKEQIVVGTPGTVLDWCFKLKVVDLSRIRLFVLDEADIMIDAQSLSHQSIRIQRALPKSCQLLLFSATFRERVRAFARQIVANPIVIKLREEELTLTNIRQYFMVCQGREHKYRALCNIYGSITIGQAMIFCQTQKSTEWLAAELCQDGHQVGILTGDLTMAQRAATIQRFRDGQEKVLIATNICARGIDVQQVTVVVNFSLPMDEKNEPELETYLHRIGRTGRFGKQGIAFSMVQSQSLWAIEVIEKHFHTKIKQLDPDNMEELEELEY